MFLPMGFLVTALTQCPSSRQTLNVWAILMVVPSAYGCAETYPAAAGSILLHAELVWSELCAKRETHECMQLMCGGKSGLWRLGATLLFLLLLRHFRVLKPQLRWLRTAWRNGGYGAGTLLLMTPRLQPRLVRGCHNPLRLHLPLMTRVRMRICWTPIRT